jgi:hypothetical protein
MIANNCQISNERLQELRESLKGGIAQVPVVTRDQLSTAGVTAGGKPIGDALPAVFEDGPLAGQQYGEAESRTEFLSSERIDGLEQLSQLLTAATPKPESMVPLPTTPERPPIVSGPAFHKAVKPSGCAGFYSLAFPELFHCGHAEFLTEPPRPPHLQPSLKVWIKQLLENENGRRFAVHDTFQYLVYHELTSPAICGVVGAYMKHTFPSLTRRQLQAKLAAGDSKIIKGLHPWTSNISGTAGAHHRRKNQISSYTRHFSYIWGGSTANFWTQSTADVHFDLFQRCLRKLETLDNQSQIREGESFTFVQT